MTPVQAKIHTSSVLLASADEARGEFSDESTRFLFILSATLMTRNAFSVATVDTKVSPTMHPMTPCQPTYCETSPTMGPSTMAPTLPTPFTRLVTPAPLLEPYLSPIIMVTEPVRSESGPQLAAPAKNSRVEQYNLPQEAMRGMRPKVTVPPMST